MGTSPNNDHGQLITGMNEPVKQYCVYTGANLTELYEARANAQHGDPCFKTEFTYVPATSLIEKLLESNATWDSSWDI